MTHRAHSPGTSGEKTFRDRLADNQLGSNENDGTSPQVRSLESEFSEPNQLRVKFDSKQSIRFMSCLLFAIKE